MTEFTFAPTQRPEITVKRERKPNPFTDVVRQTWEEQQKDNQRPEDKRVNPTVEFTVPMGETNDKGKYLGVEAALRNLREAGASAGCTVRSVANLNIDGTKPKKGTATILFWTTDKIIRTKKTDK